MTPAGKRSRPFVAVALLIAGIASAGAHAEDPDDGILTLQFENDAFAESDSQFTHGTRIAWMAPEGQVPGWAHALADYVPRFDIARSKRIVYALSQSIFTPDDISRRALIPDDRPYAGWLNLSAGLVSVGDIILDNVELGLGIVGPASFAEDVQKTWHDWFGFQRPEGWDNQLGNEPTVQITWERKWRAMWQPLAVGGFGADLTPNLGVALGNALTHGAVGLTVRIGDALPNDYGPPRIRPSLPGSDYFVSGTGFGWYLFAGVEGRAVARNIFLDGNTFRDSPSVDKKHFVADAQAGIAVLVGRARLAYTQVFRTREFDAQDDPSVFGAISLSVKF